MHLNSMSVFSLIWQDFTAQVSQGQRQIQQGLPNEYRNWILVPSAILLIAAGILALLGGYHAGFHSLNQHSSLLPEYFWAMVTFAGDTTFALVLVLFFIRGNMQLLFTILLAAVLGVLFTHGLKNGLDFSRPPVVLAENSYNLIGQAFRNGSFPSGHSQTAMTFVGCVLLYAQHNWQRTVLVTAGILVAGSRVMVGAHWPVDVLVGAAGGLLCSYAAALICSKWHHGVNCWLSLFVLSLLVTACFMIFGSHDGGYPQAQTFARIVAALALLTAIYQLLVKPITNINRS